MGCEQDLVPVQVLELEGQRSAFLLRADGIGLPERVLHHSTGRKVGHRLALKPAQELGRLTVPSRTGV